MERVGGLESLDTIFCPQAQIVFAEQWVATDDHEVQAFAESLVPHSKSQY